MLAPPKTKRQGRATTHRRHNSRLKQPEVLGNRDFSTVVVAWYRQHGRRDLPWQNSDNPYHRWVSEIMLQQTRVVTVIPYYSRFIKRFPNLKTLTMGPIDEVLEYWSGLGYYARARNLRCAAEIIQLEYQGIFPDSYEKIVSLPGIGRSTAGAILAFSYHKPYPILDSNVRRVLARYHAIGGWTGHSKVENRLWGVAEKYMAHEDIGDYTQGMMDIGAEVCLPRHPRCSICPLSNGCKGYSQGNLEQYPGPRPKRKRQKRIVLMVMVRDPSGRVLLEHRPAMGIWGGLWSFPECPDGSSPEDWFETKFRCQIKIANQLDSVQHMFTHIELEIRPLLACLTGTVLALDSLDCVWYKLDMPIGLGLPAPVRRLLKQLEDYPI
jgi:A/G-specific adenine glycosylase